MELTVGAGPELSSQVLYVSFSPALRAVPLCACACGGSGSAGGGSGALPRPSAFPLPLFQGEDVPLKEPPPRLDGSEKGMIPPDAVYVICCHHLSWLLDQNSPTSFLPKEKVAQNISPPPWGQLLENANGKSFCLHNLAQTFSVNPAG